MADSLNGLSNSQNSSTMDVGAKSQIGSIITSLEKRNFNSVVESIDGNVSVRATINGSLSHNENPENNEVDSTKGNSEAVDITYIDDSRSPTNVKAESQLDPKFIYSEGYGESETTTLEPLKKIINGSSHRRLEHSGKTIVEMDVERVLEEQDTHDLYCPNCNSCITRRVILRKRKRIIRDVQFDSKRERIEPVLQPGLLDSPAATDEASHDTGPDVFRCLSCFSIFIPTDGFRSFWIFRRNIEGENLQSSQQTAARNFSWLSAIFETFRVKNTGNEPGRETAERVQEDSLQISGQFQNPSLTQTDETIGSVFPVQEELTPSKSKTNVVQSVRSEIQNQFQEANQGPSEPGETQVADAMKWDGLIKSSGQVNCQNLTKRSMTGEMTTTPGVNTITIVLPGNSLMQQAVHDHPMSKGQLQDLEEVPTYQNKDEMSPMKAGRREIISFMDMRPGYNPEQKTSEDGTNPPRLQKPAVLSHGDANFDFGEVLEDVPKANISEDDNLQPFKEDVNAEHVNPSVQNDGNDFTVSEIPSATNDENSIKVLPVGANSNSIITFTPGVLSSFNCSPSLTYYSTSDNGINQVTDDQNSLGKVPLGGSNSIITSIPRELSPNAAQRNIKRLEDVATPVDPAADIIQSAEEGIIIREETVSSQNNQIASSSPAPGTSTGREMRVDIDQQKMGSSVRHEWDILKSIVYGGLIESVTSLVVVSSAAGSDTSTLNIVALGFANLIGGLFVIAHNLREIKKEQVISADQSEERPDRYRETLGQRENFRRHVIASVLSYIIFGLIPPVVYGFSFVRSDNKNYKLIAVAAAAFVCIAFLAICKGHVGKAPKTYVKTSLYICLGILASGLSYLAGQLLNQLLEKLRLSNPNTPASPTSVFPEPNSVNLGGWASSY